MPTTILSIFIWSSLLRMYYFVKVRCHFVNLPLNQWTFGLAFDRCVILSKCCVILSTCPYANWHFSNCHLVKPLTDVLFCQSAVYFWLRAIMPTDILLIVIWSSLKQAYYFVKVLCIFVNSPPCQLMPTDILASAIWSSLYCISKTFFNMPFCSYGACTLKLFTAVIEAVA